MNGTSPRPRSSAMSREKRAEVQKKQHAQQFGEDIRGIQRDVEKHYEDVTSMSDIAYFGDMLTWGESALKGEPDIAWEDVHTSAWLPEETTEPFIEDIKNFISDAEQKIDDAALTQLTKTAAFAIVKVYAPQLLPMFGEKGQAVADFLDTGILKKGWEKFWTKIIGQSSKVPILGSGYDTGYTTGGFV